MVAYVAQSLTWQLKNRMVFLFLDERNTGKLSNGEDEVMYRAAWKGENFARMKQEINLVPLRKRKKDINSV